jgi:hypothetical protein
MKLFYSLMLFITPFNVFSQPKFQELGFNEVVELSKQTGKLVLVQLESFDCEMCNYVGAEAFANPSLSRKIMENFIAIKVSTTHPDRNLINVLYALSDKNFGTFFIDGNKNLIHRFDQTTSLASAYEEQFNLAFYKNSESVKLNIYEDIYTKFKSNDQLEAWIWARKNLNLRNDSLLNIYVNNLPNDSLKSERVLTFIAQQAPTLGSAPDTILRRYEQFRKVWFTIPERERVSINRAVIANSMQRAILDKNEGYAYYIANFTRGTYDNNRDGIINYNRQWMKYYEGIKDIDRYMEFALVNFDSTLLKTTVADVERQDSIRKLEAMKNAKSEASTSTNGKVISRVTTVNFSAGGQYYTNALNEAAWFVYKNTENKNHLIKALEWVSKGNKYSEKFEAMDTEARILYKLGERSDAIRLMERVIQLKNERTRIATAFSSLDIVLNNMRQNKNDIDPK